MYQIFYICFQSTQQLLKLFFCNIFDGNFQIFIHCQNIATFSKCKYKMFMSKSAKTICPARHVCKSTTGISLFSSDSTSHGSPKLPPVSLFHSFSFSGRLFLGHLLLASRNSAFLQSLEDLKGCGLRSPRQKRKKFMRNGLQKVE